LSKERGDVQRIKIRIGGGIRQNAHKKKKIAKKIAGIKE